MNASSSQIHLLGVRFDNLTTAEAADRIEEFIQAGAPRMILARNAGIRVMEEHDPSLRHIYETSDLVTVDGMAFVYLGRLLGRSFKGMTGGPFLWYEVLQRAAWRGYGVFLLGTREEILQRAVQRLPHRFPGLRIVGYQNGYFTLAQEMQVVEAIRRSHADILIVGMSSPLKEEFLKRNLHQLGVPVCIGVGGAIDLFAGVVQLAPVWMRKACLEWLYRVWQEPQRLWKRYLVGNARFLLLVARELTLKRSGDIQKAQARAEGGR
jgi:N-acetylglucosaminyldiphosphoundecaprenol N-acetyl-beta-D-mannosaminyltransferase